MADDIAGIDVTCIDALRTLKDEQDVLDQRIKAMDDMKSSVAEAVYLRVRADYAAKRNVLEEQARPLREKARGEYARLLAILAALESAHETVKLDQQEIELRHTLGEFDKKEYDQRMKAIAAVAAEKGAAHEQARALRERFLAAVRAEDELRAAAPAPQPAPPAPAPAPAPPVAPPATHVTAEIPAPRADVTAEIPKVTVGGTMVMPAVPPLGAVPPPTAAPPRIEGTMVMPAPGFGAAAAAPPPPARPAAAVNEATVMFRPARLVPQNPEAGKATHALTLKPVNIGADAANEIRIGGPGVEPKHAQIVPTPKGYTLVDLDTKHGTRVNAEKIKERVLANEDVVQVGAARFVFRTS
jgi:hypothetical protein